MNLDLALMEMEIPRFLAWIAMDSRNYNWKNTENGASKKNKTHQFKIDGFWYNLKKDYYVKFKVLKFSIDVKSF